MADPARVLQNLYEAEVNFSIHTLWDCGFWWRLGDELNGYVARGRANTFTEAVAAIDQAAREHFPGRQHAPAIAS